MNQKDNKSLVDYLKILKQGKYILEGCFDKDVVGLYVENINELKNAIGS